MSGTSRHIIQPLATYSLAQSSEAQEDGDDDYHDSLSPRQGTMTDDEEIAKEIAREMVVESRASRAGSRQSSHHAAEVDSHQNHHHHGYHHEGGGGGGGGTGNRGGSGRRPSPPWYQEGAAVLAGLEEGKSTLKSLIHSRLVAPENKKKIYALVCQFLKYRPVIQEIVAKGQTKKPRGSFLLSFVWVHAPFLLLLLHLLLVLPRDYVQADSSGSRGRSGNGNGNGKERFQVLLMVYDLLFGRGIQCGGPLKAMLQAHKAQLKEELAKVKAREKVTSDADLIPERVRNGVVIPRFVRVNTLLITVEEAVATLQKQGFVLRDDFEESGGEESEDESGEGKRRPAVPEGKDFWRDQHLAEVLLFAPNTDFHLNELYTSGKVVLQDKASCFPAAVLRPPLHARVIDACAAPGNKTSHLSAIMKNTGQITAFDISSRRLDLLVKLTRKVGATNIKGESCFLAFLSWVSQTKVF